jgi:hypothetical protein
MLQHVTTVYLDLRRGWGGVGQAFPHTDLADNKAQVLNGVQSEFLMLPTFQQRYLVEILITKL